MDNIEGVRSRTTFMYVAGLETADSLVSSGKTPVPLQLYSTNIKLLAKMNIQGGTTGKDSSERH